MKKRKFNNIIISVIFYIFFILLNLLISANSKGGTVKLKFKNYSTEWEKVEEKENKGLTKSALNLVNNIYKKAKNDKNSAQLIKSTMYTMKYRNILEEEAIEKIMKEMEADLKNHDLPTKNILTSILADLYWQYYQINRYKFLKRSETIGTDEEDITTWDIRKIINKVTELYLLSLENEKELKKINIISYEDILVTNEKIKNTIYLRPTLYDFLANRALTFLMNEEAYITQPSYMFQMKEDKYFNTGSDFVNIKIITEDKDSLKYHGIQLLQNLIKFHLNDSKYDALIDVELKRLKYVKRHSVNPLKDELYFNALEKLNKKYKKSPVSVRIAYEIASVLNTEGDLYKPEIKDEYKWKKKTALDLCKKSISKFPKSIYTQDCKYLQDKIEEKYIHFTTEKVSINSKPSLSLIQYKNINKVYMKIIKLNDQEKKTAEKKLSKSYEELINYYNSFKPVESWELNLPDDKDYNKHSAELKIPSLDNGYYIVMAGSDKTYKISKNACAVSSLWISNISFINKQDQMEGEYDIYVLDREKGSPLTNITAQIWEQEYNYVLRKYIYKKAEKYKTDNKGMFKIGAKKQSRNIKIEFIGDNDRLFLNDQLYQYGKYYSSKNPHKTFFFTDRAIYRPGQTIYFKGLALNVNDKNIKILKNHKLSITFYDVNWQPIEKVNFTTNDYGTFSGSFTAPTDRLNGNMTIYAEDQSGSKYISVEEYKRPKFEVKFNPITGSFKAGEDVNIKGFAKAYAGSNIDNASVRYRVVRNAYFPYWYWWWGFYPTSKQVEITNGITKTDAKGEFEIIFNAIPDLKIDEKYMPVYTYTVYSDVTDINGETHSANTYVRVGYVALNINLDIQETVNKDGKKEFQIYSTNMNGENENSKGTIKIYKLKSPEKFYKTRLWQRPDKYIMSKDEFEKDFPHDVYNDESNFYKWKEEKIVYNDKYNTEKNDKLIIENISEWEQGKYKLILKTKDKFGKSIDYEKYFTVFGTKEKKVPFETIYWYSQIKNTGEPGENAVIDLGTSCKDAVVYYELENENKIIKRDLINLNTEKKTIYEKIKEDYRGNFILHTTFVKHNRVYHNTQPIYVYWSNKDLKMEFMTFRDKLRPGEKEEWKIKISGKNNDKLMAEMVATLYDASLDAFKANYWYMNVYPYYYSRHYWYTNYSFTSASSYLYHDNWNKYTSKYYYEYAQLNWFGFYYSPYSGYYDDGILESTEKTRNMKYKLSKKDESPKAEEDSFGDTLEEKELVSETTNVDDLDSRDEPNKQQEILGGNNSSEENVQVRKNFNETAFFYPHLETNKDGEIIISFTIPESLTKWKMLGFAHTKDLKYGFIQKELVTQKELMVMPNIPRFLREGDAIYLTSKITNLSEKDLKGKISLELFDALTMKKIDKLFFNDKNIKSFDAEKEQSDAVDWKIKIPADVKAVTYRIIAKSGNFSDGEESTIPVLTNRMLVTESLPLPVRKKGTKVFKMQKLIDAKKSDTLKHEKITLEFTPNPVWYAIQALPYLMEYPYECSEQVFSRLYANSIATHVVNSKPKIKKVFEQWKNSDALLSNLEKNQELKALLLEETPWVLQSQSESIRKKRVGLLFDLNNMSRNLNRTVNKLYRMQTPNGGFGWFEGMPDNRYITQHIVKGLARLEKMDIEVIKNNNKIQEMIQKGIRYLDNRMREDYQYLIRNKINLNEDNISPILIHYLFTRSYYTNTPIAEKNKTAFEYWKKQATKYWLNKSIYLQGMTAIALNRYGDTNTAADIIKSLKENSIEHEEMGMYWKANKGGYYWYNAPIETQALLIEAFFEVTNDLDSVESMKVWLLKQKQVQDWKTTTATADACYALILRGSDLIAQDEKIELTIGDIKIDPANYKDTKVEAGTGYFKTSWNSSEIKENMGIISVTKSSDSAAWGALYWQYFEDLDKITPHETPLKLKKELFLQLDTDKGPVIKKIKNNTKLKPGDLIKVRIILKVDRNMEYIHMKDMRASGLEPTNVISTYKYQDGLWYYESTKDASTNFFMPWLSKGTYVFEYPLRVTHKGDFSNGITTIQCMYAPEFSSHSEGVRVEVQ